MNLNPESFDVVGSVGPSREIAQVKLNLVPAFIHSHRHSTNDRRHTSGGLVVRGPKPSSNVLIIQHLDLEGEILLEVLNDHDQEGKLDSESLGLFSWAGHVAR